MRVPLWVAGLVAVGVILSVASGDAKITTSEGCREWAESIAIRDYIAGYNPVDAANFYGIGIGICFLEQTDA